MNSAAGDYRQLSRASRVPRRSCAAVHSASTALTAQRCVRTFGHSAKVSWPPRPGANTASKPRSSESSSLSRHGQLALPCKRLRISRSSATIPGKLHRPLLVQLRRAGLRSGEVVAGGRYPGARTWLCPPIVTSTPSSNPTSTNWRFAAAGSSAPGYNLRVEAGSTACLIEQFDGSG